ncbi:G-type lectin S-receptor-like serine/threonine-protein kinase At2g19130 [Cryptomeria japonica]|uniref:G-type lectin S-receptor-like serine/threonine-protein kinase At2g19130 n=1 Tax=Cryptomeria japonica TaxID=3369 RepID=UPI0027DA00FA|nr:G-type lectin S-receptor-like serine/threonine-protein kinase At2g19130 [Cryptomeria japonica]
METLRAEEKRRKTKHLEMRKNDLIAYMIFAFIVLIIVSNCHGLSTGTDRGDSLPLGASLCGNQTIISQNGTFELGFFSPNGSNNWYLGIWYAILSEKTIVWVANRESPAKKKPGVLKLSKEGNLGLFDAQGTSLWSANTSNKPSRAVLLDSGNFVMLNDYHESKPLWQSFDYPVDSWLPGMRFGGQQKLIGWKNSMDPAPGLFSIQFDPSGATQFVLTWNNSVQYWKSGTWDGKILSALPELINGELYNVSLERTSSGLYVSYTVLGVVSAFLKIKSGAIQTLSLFDDAKPFMIGRSPTDQCDVYGLCGAYGSCNSDNLQSCSCVEGFSPADQRAWDSHDWWSSGCVRQSPLTCSSQKGSTDEFIDSGATLPDDSASSYPAPTKVDCQKACLRNCSCTGFTFNSPSGPCRIWSGDLLNIQKSRSTVSIRVALAKFHKPPSSSKVKTIIVVSALALALIIFLFLMWQRYRLRQRMDMCEDSSDSSLRMFSYKELKIATINFRSKLGSGGFGSVFKGSLRDGTLVAIKNLEASKQHEKEFRAEISSLGSIQHGNLIRLRGFCAEGSRRLLAYDYMPNGSLNSLLFKSKPKVLDWKTRFQIALGFLDESISKSKPKVLDWKTRFQIALGTARGLVYLHEECRDRIIHGDIKPENILLDDNFSPKLADFGFSKLVGRDFSNVLTTTRGTRGYLAPEWISGLPITSKVDVYSFGITLLEIVSGRRSLDLSVQDSSQYYFPAWAAAQICQGRMIKIVDESVAAEADVEELRRAIVIGLLCIESEEEMRPSMGQVLRMLEGKMELKLLRC